MATVTLEQALARGHGTWRSFTCPQHEDTNPSARVNTVTGKWVCMVCHARGTINGYVPDYDAMLDESLALSEALVEPKAESWLDQFDAGGPGEYWLSRFTEDTCRRYRVGWDGTSQRPCYPIRDRDGRPLGIVKRNLEEGERKYKYPYGVSTSELLFGVKELESTETLFLMEGAPAVMAMRDAGFDAVGSYGSNLYPEQVRQIVSLQPRLVLVAYDMDKAGYEGSGPAERDLWKAGVMVERAFWDDRYSDPGDMDLETRRETMTKVLARSSTEG